MDVILSSSNAPSAFPLPTALASQGVALRPEVADDTPFLINLYASTRAAELDQMVDWTEEQKRGFVTQQFFAQRHHYRTQLSNCVFDVIEQHGIPVGRLYLQTRETQLHITDIALMPDRRGHGLGTALLDWIMTRAAADGRGVGIFVEKFNPALALYQRLGFVPLRDTGVYLEMEWTPPQLAGKDAAQLNSAE